MSSYVVVIHHSCIKPQQNQERFVPAPIRENSGQLGTNQPILGLPGNPYPKQQGPVTPQSSSPAMTSDFLSQPNQSDKKRDRTSFGDYLMQKQNVGPGQQTLGTKLVRMGAAMQGASPQGLNAAPCLKHDTCATQSRNFISISGRSSALTITNS